MPGARSKAQAQLFHVAGTLPLLIKETQDVVESTGRLLTITSNTLDAMTERRSKWDNPGEGSPGMSPEAAAAGA